MSLHQRHRPKIIDSFLATQWFLKHPTKMATPSKFLLQTCDAKMGSKMATKPTFLWQKLQHMKISKLIPLELYIALNSSSFCRVYLSIWKPGWCFHYLPHACTCIRVYRPMHAMRTAGSQTRKEERGKRRTSSEVAIPLAFSSTISMFNLEIWPGRRPKSPI